MEDAIEMAIHNSFEAYRNDYQYTLSDLRYKDIRRSTTPTLNFSSTIVDYSRSIQEQWNSDDQQFYPYEIQRLVNSGSINLTQPVMFTGGSFQVSSILRRNQTFAENGNNLNYISAPVIVSYSQDFSKPNYYKWNRRIGDAEFLEAQNQRAVNKENVRIRAINGFFELLIAQNQLSLAELNKQNADSLLWMAREKKVIFAISRADYLNLELQQSNAYIQYEKSLNDLENIRNSFNTFLGLSREQELLCLPIDDLPQIDVELREALAKVYANNPNLLSVKRRLIEANRGLQEAKLQPYNVSLSANIGYNQNRNNINEAYQDLLNQQGISLNVNIPIFDGGRNARSVQRAILAIEYQQKDLENMNIEIENEINQKINNFAITSSQLKSYAKSDTLGYFVYQATKERFILGKANMIDVINAEERRQEARINYLRQLQNYWTQYYAIRQLCLYDFINDQDLVITGVQK